MAAPQLIPAPRPRQGVPRTVAPSGVTHVRTYQPDRYTIVGNHLAQHRQLSLVAIGLAVYILSLPDGAPSDIRTLAARFPEGRDRIGFALRELEACGYLARVRERVDGGRFVTRTYAYEVPGEPVPAAPEAPADVPAAPVALAAETEPAEEEPDQPDGEQYDKAVSLLAGLRRSDDRFTLSRRDVRRLAPAVVAWFENGASKAAVRHALTDDVPVLLRSPARFLEYRLRELLPPPLPPSVPEAPGAAPAPQWYAMTTCAGECGRPFRAPPGSVCRDCELTWS
ncbi:helix-turn-helix domain-containing protein [Streptomyces sp. NPDC005876]|uniref:helix-turn-helix domain-containing protein n=1 Tax=Streptomyces sp. NPDC005876 TaxID=3157076 RepID=UPI0034050E84